MFETFPFSEEGNSRIRANIRQRKKGDFASDISTYRWFKSLPAHLEFSRPIFAVLFSFPEDVAVVQFAHMLKASFVVNMQNPNQLLLRGAHNYLGM
jgi:hypothetical protein